MRSATAPLSLSRERLANIDTLRILAAVGIVWFHTEGVPGRRIGYAALPIFLLIFFSLITRNTHADGTVHFLKRRWNRLMAPWLFWSVVYAVCKSAKAICMMDMDALRGMLSVESLLAGAHIHLWYLPYAFILGFAIYEINRRTSRANHAVVILTATATGILMLVARATGILPADVPAPLSQWSFGLAAAPLGLAVGRCLMIPSRDTRRLLLSVVSLATLLACIILNSTGFASVAIPYGIGMTLVCIGYTWRARNDAFVAYVASLTFGVYLIHPLISFGLQHLIVANEHHAAFILLTAGISGAITLGLKKTPLRRFV
jgi:peptidoglycan/LPS O-acetylase OafA/YrhL